MARPSEQDPLEKFRFSVTVLSIDLSVTGAVDTLATASANLFGGGIGRTIGKTLSVVSRAGFSEIEMPKAEVNTINYRENIDSQRFQKIPGLVKYSPVVLKRGVTDSRNLYNWYRLVNDEIVLGAVASELSGKSVSPPKQSENFRKEVIINVHNRAGEAVKQWILFNAWPVAYKGGDTLSAADDSGKLIEEITLEYEYFLELEGGLGGFAKELAKDFIESGAESLIQSQVPGLF